MRRQHQSYRSQRGSILVMVLVLSTIMALGVIGTATIVSFNVRRENARGNDIDAYYTAENALLEATQWIADYKDATKAPPSNYIDFKKNNTNDDSANDSVRPNMPYDTTARERITSCTANVINASSRYGLGMYEVYAGATVNGRTRRIYARVQWNPPSQVFDYEYFLNNWGWWWGSAITGNGDQRSNWDFDFKDSPHVNGHIYANGAIASNKTPVNVFSGTPPFNGMAKSNLLRYTHTGSQRVGMPNLKSFSEYETRANQTNGSLKINGVTMVNKVYSNSTDKHGIYLDGSTNPIVVNGTVVVHGDVIVKGKVTGQGTLYVGGNLYLAGNVQYNNPPNYACTTENSTTYAKSTDLPSGEPTAPNTLAPSSRDAWVDNNMNRDLVAFAVRESVYGGKVNTNSSNWKSNCYDASSYGLANIGNEAQLGADGIRGTADDGVAYDHGLGTTASAWNDADGDGVVDGNYNYSSQIEMNSSRIAKIDNYPKDSKSKVLDYNGSVASDAISLVDGIFYTNHAMAVYTTVSSQWRGALVLRDETIIFSETLKFYYDPRVHSRYRQKYFGNDPNRVIDLGLPITQKARILERKDL